MTELTIVVELTERDPGMVVRTERAAQTIRHEDLAVIRDAFLSAATDADMRGDNLTEPDRADAYAQAHRIRSLAAVVGRTV
jgi:hypothetical protein